MKKTLFLLCALMASLTSFGQNVLTSGKTVVPLGGLKTYVNTNGDSYTISNDDLQKITVDGNTSNVFLFPEGGYNTEANRTTGIQGFYIDLGEAKTIGSIVTTWEGAAAGGTIYVTNTEPAADGTLTGETAIATLTNAQETEKKAAVTVDNSGRYIVFVPSEATNFDWGVKIRTFVAYDNVQGQLATFAVAPTIVKAGEATTFTLSPKTDLGIDLSGVSYTVDGTAETFAGAVTLTQGAHTIAATLGGTTLTATVYALGDADAPAAPADVFEAIYTQDVAAKWEAVYNGGATEFAELTLGEQKVKPWGDVKCVFFTNSDLWADIYNVNINPTAKQYGQLHVSVFAASAVTGKVVLEQTKKIAAETAFTTVAGGWQEVVIDLDGETFIKAMSVRMDNADDIALANIYFSKAAENEDAGKIASLQVAPQIVAAGVETELTLTAADSKGAEIDNAAVTYTAEGLAEGKLTAQAGQVTIKGTTNEGAESATATVYAITAPERNTAEGIIELLQSGKSVSGLGIDWDGGYTALPNLVYSDGTQAYHATAVRKFYITNPGLTAEELTGYTKFHMDIFSTVTREGVVVNLEGINQSATVNVVAGEWTPVDVAIEGGQAATSWIWVKFAEPAGEADAELVVDNVYFSKEKVTVPFQLTVADGVATVTGDVAQADAEAINQADAMLIDLTGINSLAEGVSISPLHKNALVRIPGTVTDNVATADERFAQLAGVRNAIVTATWNFPLQQIQIDANDGEPLWNGEGATEKFISTGERGYRITRTISGVTTAYYPVTVTAPQGIEVYELAGVKENGELYIEQKENGELVQGYPYVLKAAEATELVVEGTGDLNLNIEAGQKTLTDSPVAMQGVLAPVTTDEQQYLLGADLTVSAAAGQTVAPFRAYFTGLTAATKLSTEKDQPVPDAIEHVQQAATAAATYTLSGQRVLRTTTKGVFISNGKKHIVR